MRSLVFFILAAFIFGAFGIVYSFSHKLPSYTELDLGDYTFSDYIYNKDYGILVFSRRTGSKPSETVFYDLDLEKILHVAENEGYYYGYHKLNDFYLLGTGTKLYDYKTQQMYPVRHIDCKEVSCEQELSIHLKEFLPTSEKLYKYRNNSTAHYTYLFKSNDLRNILMLESLELHLSTPPSTEFNSLNLYLDDTASRGVETIPSNDDFITKELQQGYRYKAYSSTQPGCGSMCGRKYILEIFKDGKRVLKTSKMSSKFVLTQQENSIVVYSLDVRGVRLFEVAK